MDYIEITGTFYEVGKQLGVKSKNSVQLILDDFKNGSLYSKIQAYLETREGKIVVDNFQSTIRTYCGQYLEELEGLADGACVSFDDLLLFNLDHEFVSIFDETPGCSHDVIYASLYDGCTNISMETENGQTLFAHHEDMNPLVKDMGMMVKYMITNHQGNIIEEFVDFVVPGFLSGSKFGFNRHGIVMGHNCIVQQGINLNGIPRKFMCRSLCDVKNTDEARRSLESDPGMATSYTFHFVQMTNNGIENTVIETANSDSERLVTAFKPKGFYHHCNILQHLEYPCHPEESSVHRAAVLSQYMNRGERCDKQMLCSALSNTHDPNFPVYRNGRYPDYLAHIATGLYDVSNGTLEVYKDKPTESAPVHVFNIPHT